MKSRIGTLGAGELERLEAEAAAEKARKERKKSFWESVTDAGAPTLSLGMALAGTKSREEPAPATADSSSGGFKFNFGPLS